MINLLPTLDKENSLIVVAMSGGVDSSTVAALLHKEGYKVIGITLQLYDYGAFTANKKGACCAGQDIYDAKMVANRLNIPHYVLNYESRFKEAVIDDFADTYLSGETPLPCVKCNQSVKFQDLLKMAKSLGANALVTGHYARRIDGSDGRAQLHKAIDPQKDQSYFLFATTKEQLEYIHFPLGNFSKDKTRSLAKELGVFTADKPDSQDICFVPGGDYREVVKKIRPTASLEGKILHIDGFALGTHKGIINYTIGQRRGLGISFDQPLYVVKIDAENNIVYVGPESALSTQKFIMRDVNILGNYEDIEGKLLEVKFRSTKQAAPAHIKLLDNNKILVEFLEPQKAISPGQASVIYQGNRLLGGGWITKFHK